LAVTYFPTSEANAQAVSCLFGAALGASDKFADYQPALPRSADWKSAVSPVGNRPFGAAHRNWWGNWKL